MTSKAEKLTRLRDIYYDAETGFKSANDTYQQAKAAGLTQGPNRLLYKDVKEFLKKQESVQLTTKFKRPTKFTSIRAKSVGEKYQTDLMELKPRRNGYRFILQVIDIHSRYAWSIPILNKKGKTVTDAFRDKVLSEAKRTKKGLKLKHVHSDEGKEYLNSDFQGLLQQNGIEHTYSYEGEYAKNSIVERFNLTLRQLMEKRQGRFKVGEDSFQAIVRNYNNTKHRTIKATPADVWNKKAKNTQHYRDMLYGFKKGDRVRALYKKKLFEKGTYGWSKEVYRISRIDKQKHYVKDAQGRHPRDKKGRKRYYMGYQLQRVKDVQVDPKADHEQIQKELAEAKSQKAADRQKRKLKKEGLDDAPQVLSKGKRLLKAKASKTKASKTKAKPKTKKAKAKATKKQQFLERPEGRKVEVKYAMDDGSTQWFEGTVKKQSKSKGKQSTYKVKFPGEPAVSYSFTQKSSPHYIEPRSWRPS